MPVGTFGRGVAVQKGGAEMSINKAQRRQMKTLADHVDTVVAGDRAFFEQHSHRTHRIRVSHVCEIAANEIVEGKPWTLPPGLRWFTVIRNVAPGIRSRLFGVHYDDAPTDDVDEATARGIYERLKTPHTQAFEEAVRRSRTEETRHD